MSNSNSSSNNNGLYKNFRGDLDFGTEREIEFMSYFGGKMSKGSGRKEDLILDNGELVELKAERYFIFEEPPKELVEANPKKRFSTKSLFIEFSSSSGKEVGPFRAERDGIKYYIHFFLDGVCFVFNTKELCDWLRATDMSKYKEWKCINRQGSNEWSVVGKLVNSYDLKTAGVAKVLKLYDYKSREVFPLDDTNGDKNYKKFFK